MRFEFTPLSALPEVVLVSVQAAKDERGWFVESYKRSEFERHGIAADFRQDNHSYSRWRGTLRGLHFQNPPAEQGKLVRCARGEIFDVAVDLRRGSPRFGRSASVTLDAASHRLLWVPPGFAHAFQTLTDDTEVAYKVTSEYSPAHDRNLRWNDPRLGIAWPVPDPILSAKDRDAPLLADCDARFEYAPAAARGAP